MVKVEDRNAPSCKWIVCSFRSSTGPVRSEVEIPADFLLKMCDRRLNSFKRCRLDEDEDAKPPAACSLTGVCGDSGPKADEDDVEESDTLSSAIPGILHELSKLLELLLCVRRNEEILVRSILGL